MMERISFANLLRTNAKEANVSKYKQNPAGQP